MAIANSMKDRGEEDFISYRVRRRSPEAEKSACKPKSGWDVKNQVHDVQPPMREKLGRALASTNSQREPERTGKTVIVNIPKIIQTSSTERNNKAKIF